MKAMMMGTSLHYRSPALTQKPTQSTGWGILSSQIEVSRCRTLPSYADTYGEGSSPPRMRISAFPPAPRRYS